MKNNKSEIEKEKGCGKRTDFENNGLFYNKPICSFNNLCSECKKRLEQ